MEAIWRPITCAKEEPAIDSIIIINFNQLLFKKLVNFLVKKSLRTSSLLIIFLPTATSTEYYKTLKGVKVEYMDENYGHMVFKNKELQEKYGKGFYVVTDADIVPR